MLVYLDSAQNRKGAPNENFAREVMELFTLGEGHYTEQDVKEAARAFTGWSLDRETRRVRVPPRAARRRRQDRARQDRAASTATRCSTSCSRAPRPPSSSTAKLWREFVSPDPDPARSRSASPRASASRGYDIKVALRELLLCDAFYARGNRGMLVKVPVELVVGTLRTLDVRPGRRDCRSPSPRRAWARTCSSPPNVKGWPGGEAWINTQHAARAQAVPRSPDARGRRAVAHDRRDGRDDAMPACAPSARCAAGVADDDKARAQRFVRAIERGVRSVQFDSARWIAQLPGATPTRSAQRGAAAAAADRAAAAAAIATPTRCAFVRALRARPRLPAQMTDRSARWTAARSCSSLAAAALARARRRLGRRVAFAAAPAGADYRKLLVLIELKGGNDGLNTLVPYADPAYYALRPKLAIARDEVVQLSDRAGLHPALAPLLPLWKDRRARGAAGRRLSRAQPVAFPLDRDLGHGVGAATTYLHGRLAHARVRARAGAARVRRRRRHHRQQRSRPARRRRHARDRARRTPSSSCAGAARRPGRRSAQQGARAHPARSRPTSCRRRRTSTRATRSRPSFRRADSAMRSRPRARSSPIRPASPSCA